MWTRNSSYWVTHTLLLRKKRLSLNVFNAQFRICTKFITFASNYSKESKRLDWCSIWNWIADVLPGFLEYPLFSSYKLVGFPPWPYRVATRHHEEASAGSHNGRQRPFKSSIWWLEDSAGGFEKGWREENCTSLRKQRAFPSLCQDEKGRRRKNRNTY